MIKLLAKLKPYVLACILLVGITFIEVNTELSLPTYMADIINIGIPRSDKAFIFWTAAKMLGYIALGIACGVFSGFLNARVSSGYGRDLRNMVFSKAVNSSIAAADSIGTASFITRTTNDINQVQMFVILAFSIGSRAPLMIIGGILMSQTKSTDLSWVVFLSVPLLMILVLSVGFVVMPLSTSLQKKIDQVNRIMREKLTGIRVARAFGAEEYEERRFDTANGDLARTMIRMNRIMAVLMPGIMLLLSFTQIALVWFGAIEVQQGDIMVGDVMAVVQYVMQIMFSFMIVTMVFAMFPRANASARRINQVLNLDEAMANPADVSQAQGESRGMIEFRNVSFCYGGTASPALRELSFTAYPGQTTAIIGSTGSGKTTILSLILRFYEATSGQILIDGVDISQLPPKGLRARIGYVPQKAMLFRGTIAENIRYGNPDATDAQVEAAAKTAQAMEFIAQKPEGMEASVAQLGSNLSGGQKQRLAIARAIVRKPQIYLFDDSFSALDAKTDQRLRSALRDYTGNATVIIVAQKVSTILNAHRIIVLDKGECVGQGTHEELCRTCEVYQEIVASQMSAEEGNV